MTPDVTLHRKLSEAARRIRILLVSHWTARSLCWTSLLCLIWLAAAKIGWVGDPSGLSVGCTLVTGALTGVVVGATRRVTRADVAALTDERTKLKERLTSAVQFEAAAETSAFARLQLDDAGAHAKHLDLRRAYPMRVTREMVAAAVLALALMAAFFLPSMPIFWSREKRQEVAEVKRWAAAIEKPIRIAEKAADQQKLDETAKAAKEAMKLAAAMKRQNMSMKAAMVNMTKLTKQIQEQQRRMADANSTNRPAMQKAAADIRRALADQQRKVEQAAVGKQADTKRQGKDAPKPGEKPNPADAEKQAQASPKAGLQQSQAMQQAQQALQQFAQALADQNSAVQNQALQQLADQLQSGQMSKEEMQTLQQQMQQMANALQGTNLKEVAKQMQQMAQMMQQLKLDPQTLKRLAALMRKAGGT